MRARAWCALAVAWVLAFPLELRAQQDPRLQWQTLETPRFRIHFYQQAEPIARRVAEIAEGAADRLAVPLGWQQSQRTEIVLSDSTDDANGTATALPYNTVHLFVTSPDDLSTLNQYDDWLSTLVTHEYTHVLHTDRISGVAAVVNAVFGKLWAPNQVQPRWILEGLAVYEETQHTAGGRLRSSIWDMQLRADALADNLVTLDQLTNGPNRWPHGNIWYLYGSYVMQYVADRFGPEALAELSREYGGMTFPWALGRAIRRITGQDWEGIYEDFLRFLRARYDAQRAAIVARGQVEGARLTRQGEEVRSPRFLPDGTLVYESADNQSQPVVRALPPEALERPGVEPYRLEWLASSSGVGVDGDRRLVVSDLGPYRDIYYYHDLFLWTLGRDADGRLERTGWERLTEGWRAQQPDVSPDGDHVVFTVNHRGTTALFEMSIAERVPHCLFRPRRFEQVYAPRYAPDGSAVAFSWWRSGGRRDLALWERATGRVRTLTDDPALDLSPSFSPDGAVILWSSDRTGVMNLYAYERATGRVRQVTNALLGAFQPAVSPDQRWIAYVGYSHRGYDLFRMPYDPPSWRSPDRVPDPLARGDAHAGPARAIPMELYRYSPWATLRPRSWLLDLTSDGFGPQLGVRSNASDVLGRHAWSARVGVGLVRGDTNVDLGYVYRGVRPTLRMHAYRTVEPGTGYRVGRTTVPWVAERLGGETELSVGFPGFFEGHTLSLAYEAYWQRALGGLPDLAGRLDPSEAPPSFPFQGFQAGLRGTWFFNRSQRYAYSITQQQGFNAQVSVRVQDALLGSSTGSVDVSAGMNVYVPMPWSHNLRRHILAVHLGLGIGTADRGERGVFSLGGFPNFSPSTLLDAFRSGTQAGGIALRGYAPNSRVGSQFQVVNLEYRFPVLQLQRGPSTLPVFVQRLTGDVFLDVGNASYGTFRWDAVALGTGVELLADLIVGYVVPFTVRVGYARGLTDDGDDQLYGLLSSPF
ncbi:MAG: PD40 domain-containing protein [Deltaproteobacteria bacterium]|nr:PD40 domain-containing protein [Deltaproteobacteria bacterium]